MRIQKENIDIKVAAESKEDGLLKRWSAANWKSAFGVNIYEMYGDLFLFEFPNRFIAEKILQGHWSWKKSKFNLEWWNPIAGCIQTWFQLRLLQSSLCSSSPLVQESFSRNWRPLWGCVATEEETELKNHLKWARILVSNDGRNVPREVVIVREGIIYHIPDMGSILRDSKCNQNPLGNSPEK